MMKMVVVVETLQNYEINVIGGQKFELEPGLILHMKNGAKSQTC